MTEPFDDNPGAPRRQGGDASPRFRVFWFTGTWPVAFRALRHRNFRLFWSGQFVSLIGTWMQSVAQSWLVLELVKQEAGQSNTSLYLGIISAIGSLPMLLFTLFAGVVADRHDKRRILIITQTSAMVLAFGLAALVSFGVIRLWEVALYAVLAGTVASFDMPTRQAFVKDMVGPEDLLNAIALNSSIFNGARIIGPAVGGALIALPHVGVAGAFYINGISFLAVIAGIIMIRYRFAGRTTDGISVWRGLREGFKYVHGHRTIRTIMLLMAVYSIFGFSYIVLLPVIATEVLGVQERGYGLLVAASGAGALIGALVLASTSSSIRKGEVLRVGGLLFSLALIGLGFSRVFWVSGLLLMLVGGGLVISSASINSLIQEMAPDELRGRVVSMWTFIFAGFTPLGALYAGTVSHLTSPATALLISGALLFAVILVGLVAVPWLWRLP